MAGKPKIAVFKLGGLGDLVMATPALRSLKQSLPDAELVLITGKSNRQVLAHAPFLDSCFAIDDVKLFQGSAIQKATEAFALWKRLVRLSPDILVLLHRDWRYSLIAKAAGIKHRYGLLRSDERNYLTRSVPNLQSMHETDKYHSVFSLVEGYSPSVREMQLFPTDEERAKTKAFFSGARPGKRIAIAVGGAANAKLTMSTKRWPSERYKSLIAYFLDQGHTLVFPGAPSDKSAVEGLLTTFPDAKDQLLDATGKFSVTGTYALMQHCDVMVSHDCGPMHLGSASGIPVVALFGPTDPAEYGPVQHPKSHTIWKGPDLDCSPCYDHGYFPPCDHVSCMKGISVEEVAKRVDAVLVG